MKKFIKMPNGFNYFFEKTLAPFEEVIVKLPTVSSNKRGINDIGWVCTNEATLWGTLSSDPENCDEGLWQQIIDRDEINKTVTALKVKNGNAESKVIIRAILN